MCAFVKQNVYINILFSKWNVDWSDIENNDSI